LIEGVRGFGGGEAGVLANGPRAHRVHGGLRAAHEGRQAGQGVGVRQTVDILFGVERLDDDAFRRDPVQGVDIAAGSRFGGGLFPGLHGVGVVRRGVVCVGHEGTFHEICGNLWIVALLVALGDSGSTPIRRVMATQ